MINLAGDDQLILNDYERSLFDLGISIFFLKRREGQQSQRSLHPLFAS